MSASSEFAPHAARTRSSPRSTSGRQGHRGEVKEVPKEVGVGAGLVVGAAEGDRRVRRDALVAVHREGLLPRVRQTKASTRVLDRAPTIYEVPN